MLTIYIGRVLEIFRISAVNENNSLPRLIGFLPILLIILVVLIIGMRNDAKSQPK